MLAEPERPKSAAERPTLPYPGLRPFEETETRNFFGRESEIRAILGLLEEEQLVVVHGASGCGKSSVVRAGVLPTVRLDALASGTTAKIVVIRPSDPGGPLRSLAAALERAFSIQTAADRPDQEAEDPPESAWVRGGSSRRWSETLVASPDWKADIEAAAKASGCALCIVLDQFEEIFALQRKGMAAEVDRVIEFLISLGDPCGESSTLGERPLSVIVTMRSDYLGHCSLWNGFAETVNRAQYLLPKISTVGLLRAIHLPALKYGGSVDEAVADQLLPVMAGEIDGLPVLQHALMRAWQNAKPRKDGKRTVSVANLNRIGGAAGALSKHAEEAFKKAIKRNDALKEAAEWIFRALSDVDADGRIIRRTVLLSDLVAQTGADTAAVRAIVDRFRQIEFSFLTPFPPEELTEESNISVTHEALLRRWEKISSTAFDEEGRPAGLVYREFIDGMIWRALSVQAEQFASTGRGVLSAAATEVRLPWYREIAKRPGWALRYPVRSLVGSDDTSEDQWRKVADFMTASEVNLQRELTKLEREREMVAKLKKNRRMILGLATVVLLLVGVATATFLLVRSANQAAIEAQRKAAAYVEMFEGADALARDQCSAMGDATEPCVRQLAPIIYYDMGRMAMSVQRCSDRGFSGSALENCAGAGLRQSSPSSVGGH